MDLESAHRSAARASFCALVWRQPVCLDCGSVMAAARYNGESMEDGSLMSREVATSRPSWCAPTADAVPLAKDLAQFGPF